MSVLGTKQQYGLVIQQMVERDGQAIASVRLMRQVLNDQSTPLDDFGEVLYAYAQELGLVTYWQDTEKTKVAFRRV